MILFFKIPKVEEKEMGMGDGGERMEKIVICMKLQQGDKSPLMTWRTGDQSQPCEPARQEYSTP